MFDAENSAALLFTHLHFLALVVGHRLSDPTLAWHGCCVNSPFQDKPGRRDQWVSCKNFRFLNLNDRIINQYCITYVFIHSIH